MEFVKDIDGALVAFLSDSQGLSLPCLLLFSLLEHIVGQSVLLGCTDRFAAASRLLSGRLLSGAFRAGLFCRLLSMMCIVNKSLYILLY